ncbi:hypothetical protein PoB_006315000 [Plakobranchus ocellatus]|uniref:Uncharacterized protein n=1 Tax=Plakobranchus ocellatus TaxID=259542 RepID=A0AAV4CXX3_9GAST|nr:hypothetical protein PoB_006315000 [Plakobranchus ocellatus]
MTPEYGRKKPAMCLRGWLKRQNGPFRVHPTRDDKNTSEETLTSVHKLVITTFELKWCKVWRSNNSTSTQTKSISRISSTTMIAVSIINSNLKRSLVKIKRERVKGDTTICKTSHSDISTRDRRGH